MANPRLGADEPSAYLIGGEASSKLYLGADLLWTNPTPPEPSGPLAVHWDFNDPSPTTSTDLVAGKVMSLNTMSKVASRNGTGLQSSSTTGMATVSEGLVNPAEFTITAWIYTTGQYAGLRFKSGGQAGASKIEMYGRYQISGSRMYLQTYQRAMVNGAWVLGYMNSNIQNATEIIPAWNFFTLTFDSTTIRAWMNAVSRQSAAATGPIDPVDFFEVMSLTSTVNDAIVDDVRIYNKVLTQAEIQAAMAE